MSSRQRTKKKPPAHRAPARRKRTSLVTRYRNFRRWQHRRQVARARWEREKTHMARERLAAEKAAVAARAERERVRLEQRELREARRTAAREAAARRRAEQVRARQARQPRIRPVVMAASAAAVCGQPTEDGSPCQRLAGPGGCGVDHAKVRSRS